ncbi:uracil-xanthine permease family protein [Streptomyces rubradiris]|uniref:Nucleobase:cation symporter n=1 Tax=Streptomyces rubradiris TaxID=285531 RepID=A0ABQ3R9F6_STRRR|nr:solute carrier family 23 protein [Streptomyces rubradiris]GHG99992.1 nucleobase:cation symporter [Streptomyces rubradiris]GHI52491.1 nucleobase:cation symporter [Streptomyces rubradiris]
MTSIHAPAATRSAEPVDARVPLRRLVPLAAQHVLVLIAAPVSTVFLVAGTLRMPPGATASLLSAVLLLCGAGALLQSLGVWRIGGRLPFVMLPGGAATALFLQIAQDHGAPTATGSVLLAAALLLAVLPLYTRVVRLFPPLVMGVTVLLIGVAMIRVAARLVTGPDGRGEPRAVLLAALTVAATVAAYVLLRGVWRQTSVLIGMAAGTVVAVTTGLGAFTPAAGAGFALPALLPFGPPRFDLVAALPLLVFSLTTLTEITGQTVLNSETVGRTPTPERDVPRVARADALVSLAGGLFGTSLMVTSAENIGIGRLTGVRSRFVTAGAGVLLVVVGLATPVSRALAGIPEAVVGGSALVVYAVIAVMGVEMLRRADLSGPGTGNLTAALALTMGLLPLLSPELYAGFPEWARTILGSGVVAGTLTAVVLTALLGRSGPGRRVPAPAQSRVRE